jgi:hypothetical protein
VNSGSDGVLAVGSAADSQSGVRVVLLFALYILITEGFEGGLYFPSIWCGVCARTLGNQFSTDGSFSPHYTFTGRRRGRYEALI